MKWIAIAAMACLGAACTAWSGDKPAVGDEAPDFSLPGTDGKTHTLQEHRGKRAVVIAWYPKASTPG